MAYAGFAWCFGLVGWDRPDLRQQCQSGGYASLTGGLERFSWEVGYTPGVLFRYQWLCVLIFIGFIAILGLVFYVINGFISFLGLAPKVAQHHTEPLYALYTYGRGGGGGC